ncbi:HypC/HybG/HupF family hydrogenase formation chaperone [bacterium]|nr:HypC/HybG/HupF family hydrogenase formation chaperone [bacterium]
MCLAIPGRVVSVDGEGLLRTGQIDFNGIVREVSLSLLPDAMEHDWVLVHAGFALNVIDEEEAERTLDDLRRLGELGGGLMGGDEFDRRERADGNSNAPPDAGA